MGGGSTIAAAMAVGYDSVGIEIDPVFFKISEEAIPRLAQLEVGDNAPKPGPRHRKYPSEGVLALPFQM
jgi:DNA modification methylase